MRGLGGGSGGGGVKRELVVVGRHGGAAEAQQVSFDQVMLPPENPVLVE